MAFCKNCGNQIDDNTVIRPSPAELIYRHYTSDNR